MSLEIIIIGGGAAGFFAAIRAAEVNPDAHITILEKGKDVLQKVKISGGGRCNVTHACFDPKELVQYYPRGQKELLGPFHQFMTGDTMQWFEDRGVPLKIEDDNRVFPMTNSSQSIIDVLTYSADKLGVRVELLQKVENITKSEKKWVVKTNKSLFKGDKLLIATGSNSKIWKMVEELGHSIIPPVPSLFTFNIEDTRLKEIPGLSVPMATVKILDFNLESSGPLLITHWGISGPAVLKLSAFAALFLAEKKYKYSVQINWLSESEGKVKSILEKQRKIQPKNPIWQRSCFQQIPKRLWQNLVQAAGMQSEDRWADISKKEVQELSDQLTQCLLIADGKSTFKEEFVTAGGIDLKEINFKRFESKLHPNLFFAGEVLNIDAVTGGFNFQNAWTGGYIVGSVIGQ